MLFSKNNFRQYRHRDIAKKILENVSNNLPQKSLDMKRNYSFYKFTEMRKAIDKHFL